MTWLVPEAGCRRPGGAAGAMSADLRASRSGPSGDAAPGAAVLSNREGLRLYPIKEPWWARERRERLWEGVVWGLQVVLKCGKEGYSRG